MTEDHPGCEVVLSESDIDQLTERSRFGVVAQTTQPVVRVRQLVEHLRNRFPSSEIRFTDTVCQPTKDRQSAAEELARAADVVLVIGGANSNNTRRLADTCRTHCARVHPVTDASELDSTWFQGAETVGITAGTSTPDRVIDAVEAKVRDLVAPASGNRVAC